jgi:hypothetical protein
MNLIDQDAVNALMKSALAAPSEDIARSILTAAGMDPNTLQKTISTGTGLIAYDLQAPAKNLYPVYTPIRNRIPRVAGGIGTATNWRQVNAIIGSGWDGMGWVPEGQRSGQMSYSTSNKAASYVTIGEEDGATFEAINAGRTFEDIQARMTMRLLQKTMLKEENGLLFGNNSVQLGTPGTPTLAAAGSGATLPAVSPYSVIVVALSGEGYANSTRTGTLAVATTKTITGADGKTYTLNGGASNQSAAATQAVTLGQTLSCSVAAVQGAVAYAWFIGAAGSEKLAAITTINSVAFSAPLGNGSNQAATAVAADYSTNATAFDGLFTTAAKSGSGAYVNYLATGTAGTGTPLTASGRGSVVEIDAMMRAMWDSAQLSISILFVNSQELKNITTKVLTGASGGSLINYFQDPKAGEYVMTAGGTIEFYYNPFMAPGAGRRIPIMIHPMVPPGTIVGWAESLPIQYQSNDVPNIAEVRTRQDYYQIDWPITTRQRQVGVYSEQVLAIYAPFGMGIISNIANG